MQVRASLKTNLFASWIVHAVVLLIGVFLMPYVLHTLGDQGYGVWIFINSIAAYSGLLYFGFGGTISRYVARFHAKGSWDELNQVVNVIFWIYLAMGLFAFLVAALLAWLAPILHVWDDPSATEVQLVILILGLNITAGMAGSVFGGVLMGVERFDIERGVALGSAIARLLLTLAFLQASGGLLILALIHLVVTVLENLAYAVFAFRLVPRLSIRLAHFRRKMLGDCLSFSFYVFVDAIAAQLITATDTIVIGLVLGAESIVPYYIALRVCQLIAKPIEQIGRISMPRAGALYAHSSVELIQNLAFKGVSLSLLLAAGLYIGAAFFGGALVDVWVGTGYEETPLILLVLMVGQLVAIPVGVLRAVLFGVGQVRLPSLVYLAEALANVALSLLLIGPLGLLGVAPGTTIPIVVIELGILVPFAVRRLHLPPGRMIRQTLAPLLLPLAALLLYSYLLVTLVALPDGWIALGLVSAGGGIVLGIGWLASRAVLRLLPDAPLAVPTASAG